MLVLDMLFEHLPFKFYIYLLSLYNFNTVTLWHTGYSRKVLLVITNLFIIKKIQCSKFYLNKDQCLGFKSIKFIHHYLYTNTTT